MIPGHESCSEPEKGKPRASGDDPSVKINGISILE